MRTASLVLCVVLVGTAVSQDPPRLTILPTKTSAPSAKLLFPAERLIGIYYFGDGLGVNCTLELKKDHTFSFRWRGCLGEYDKNHGKWGLDGDVVVLDPELPNEQRGFQGLNVRFVPMIAHGQLLLADENGAPRAASLLKNFKVREQYAHGSDFLLTNSVPESRDGWLCPARYRDFLENGPVRCKVTKVNADGTVILDEGVNGRLKPGLLLAIEKFERLFLEVKTVNATDAVAKPFYVWNSGRKVKVGDPFSTGSQWTDVAGTGYRRYDSPPDGEKPPAR